MKWLRVAAGLLLLAAFSLAVAWLAGAFEAAPGGVQPIAWDRETCAQCHMHIGDPRYAAQLQTRSEGVLNFDDPGCLFRYLQAHQVAVREAYFHHHEQDRWLTRSEVGFVPVEHTPMGYGLAATTAASGALTLEQARAQVLDRSETARRQP